MTTLALTGTRPEPLASYLKALGVFRIVAEQADRTVRGAWAGEHFALETSLDREMLLRFFAEQWRPTPVVAPWNGGSGFYPKDNKEGPDAILASSDPRLMGFADAIRLGRSYVAAKGWEERPQDDAKAAMLADLRARLADDALGWLDAAIVLGDEKPLFAPLLGTGGNDGRLEFSNNFQQRVVEALGDLQGLTAALFGDASVNRSKGTMGQYLPSAQARTNPWDYVFLIEGAMMFAAGATRRLESGAPMMLSFPFHARSSQGFATLTDFDEAESRDELWLPLWRKLATLPAIRRLFAEGRASVGSADHAREAVTGLDFARSASSLGVDRGINEFTRVGFQVRNGLSFFATPLGRFAVGNVLAARLLDEIDDWYARFRSKALGARVPARVSTARRRLEQALFETVITNNPRSTLLELGAVEQALGASASFATKAFLRPLRRLVSPGWLDALDGSVESRLGLALSLRPNMRRRLVPLDHTHTGFGESSDAGFVFRGGPLVDSLHDLLLREELEVSPVASASFPACSLDDISRFIDGEVDDSLVEAWLRALLLVESPTEQPLPLGDNLEPPVSYMVLKLVHGCRLGDEPIPRTAGVLAVACGGNARDATARAIRRLNASGRPLPASTDAILEPPSRMRRIAAALAFPITQHQRKVLERIVLPPLKEPQVLQKGVS